MKELLNQINGFLWGPWMLAFMLGSGLFLLVRMRFLPIRNLGYALCCLFGEDEAEKKKIKVLDQVPKSPGLSD